MFMGAVSAGRRSIERDLDDVLAADEVRARE
jgi:hypothetical protein